MAKFVSPRRLKAFGLGATLTLCLALLQLAISIGSPARRDYGAGFSRLGGAASFCAQLAKDADKTPSPPSGHAHKDCLACALGQAASLIDNSTLASKGGAPAVRDATVFSRSWIFDVASVLAAGFASSWSSRAPPIFS
jgi:hypothetical protein